MRLLFVRSGSHLFIHALAVALAIGVALGCSTGGQSGNEGNPPEPPCFVPGGEEGAVVRLTELRDGCVSGEVQRFLAPVESLPPFRVGEVIAFDYFADAALATGDELLVFYRAETETAVGVLITDGHVTLPWGVSTVSIALDDLTGADCRTHFPPLSERGRRSGETIAVAPPGEERASCFLDPP
jgi:hypothetical protein